ncbi:MAG: D-alanyl-D-alanine carboxypeptidase [Bacteroidales bacterium]|nr:D-alanyl-D-alanine carboxypeptidase [Candidatus Cryptobacteroides choladohippi]
MKGNILISLTIALLLDGGSAIAAVPQTAAQRTISAALAKEPFRSGACGVLAVRMNGDTLACVNPRQRLVPASNMKLVSTGLALRRFGADFRFTTTLAYSGEIVDSTLVGDLYILGGGDPTIGSKSECARGASDTFGNWAAILRRAGVRRIEGNVIGDPRFFNDPSPDNMGASYEDIGTAYGTGPTGLCFFENQQTFFVSPGTAAGLNVLVVPRYPDTPWMQYSCAAKTGAPKSVNSLYYVCTEFGPYGEVRGSFPIDRKGYTLECANRFGAYTCAYYFWKYLNSNGLPADGYGDVAPRGYIRTDLAIARTGSRAPAQGTLKVLGAYKSPCLADIASDTNAHSDNFFAETLFRMLGKDSFGSTLQDSCRVAANNEFKSLGINPDLCVDIYDGSGLSRKNYASASFFVAFLRAMARSQTFRPFYASLPQPGQGKSSLENRFREAPQALKDRIHMKSGSMNGVRCFSGYIDSPDGDPSKMVVFSVLTNNITKSSYTVYPLIEDIIAAIAAEN